MRKLCLLLLLTPLAFAQSPFDGTWKANVQSAQFPQKPDVYVLQNGHYTCSSCVPKIDVQANGQDQPVTGDPYSDHLNAKVVDANTVELTYKKDGKVIGTDKITISEDGKTLTDDFMNQPPNSDKPVHGQAISERVAQGPAGAHKLSGSWRTTKLSNLSDNGITWTWNSTGDSLTMKRADGSTYTAKFDGKDYPMSGDPGVTTVSLKKVDDRTIEETDKRNGKVIAQVRWSVSADGKNLNVVADDKLRGTSMKWSADKQEMQAQQ